MRAAVAVAAGELGVRRLDDPAPHVAERNEAEEVHVVGRAGAGIVGLGEPHSA